jgi:integration host factor subunit beta
MTKSDLIDLLCEAEKMPKGRAEVLINAIFDCMEASLRRGERIEIRGFGSFEIRNYRAYEGRNPRTGSTVNVRPKRLPFFKVGKELKERVNDGAGKAPQPRPAAAKPAAGNGDGVPQPAAQTTTGPVDAGTSTAATAVPGATRAIA